MIVHGDYGITAGDCQYSIREPQPIFLGMARQVFRETRRASGTGHRPTR